MGTRIGVGLMAVLMALYLVVLGQRAVILMLSGEPVGVALGVGLVILPMVGVWALVRELHFGVRSARLARILGEEGGLPVDDLPTRASGRPVREAADASFPGYQAEVEQDPASWRAWFRLGLAYDASGDRRRARGAIRRAIALQGAEPAP
jgi:cytochrome c-type biogenesis protein CcmH/NrfG